MKLSIVGAGSSYTPELIKVDYGIISQFADRNAFEGFAVTRRRHRRNQRSVFDELRIR